MKEVSPGHYEYNAEGTFLDGCFACGLTFQAYLPICASGNNSAVLHYNDNHRLMQNGDILLIDAGAEYFGYAADITRTPFISSYVHHCYIMIMMSVMRSEN